MQRPFKFREKWGVMKPSAWRRQSTSRKPQSGQRRPWKAQSSRRRQSTVNVYKIKNVFLNSEKMKFLLFFKILSYKRWPSTSTTTRLRFSSGRHRPDWAFLLVGGRRTSAHIDVLFPDFFITPEKGLFLEEKLNRQCLKSALFVNTKLWRVGATTQTSKMRWVLCHWGLAQVLI